MRTAWPLLLCLVPFLAHCKHPKEEQKLSEAVVPESFAIRCSRTDPSSELGLTYRALIESVQAENCQTAALKLQGISFLVLNEKNIKDLSPLSEFEQLQWLHLYGNRIEDISPLRKLVKLKDLVLDNNQVSDLSPIKGLSNLQELYLGRNKLTKIDALEALKNIYILNLSGNQISDAKPLVGLQGLMVLDLKNNPIMEHKSSDTCPNGDGVNHALRDFCNQ